MGGTEPSRSGHRGVAVLTALALVTLLGACTDTSSDDVAAPSFAPVSPSPSESDSTPPASTEPSPAATEPVVTAPPLPEAATEQTPEGAVAFTEWWFDTLNYATATGDTEALRAASDPGCEFCDNSASQVEAAVTDGGQIVGGLTEVEVTAPGAIQELGVNLAVFAAIEATTILDNSGEVVQEFDGAESQALIASVLLSESGWRMGAVSQ